MKKIIAFTIMAMAALVLAFGIGTSDQVGKSAPPDLVLWDSADTPVASINTVQEILFNGAPTTVILADTSPPLRATFTTAVGEIAFYANTGTLMRTDQAFIGVTPPGEIAYTIANITANMTSTTARSAPVIDTLLPVILGSFAYIAHGEVLNI